jgi:hypothetical protein
MASHLKRTSKKIIGNWHFTIGENGSGEAQFLRFAPCQSTSAVVLGKFMSVEGIARVTLRQTGEQAAGLGLVLVAER